MEFGLLNRRHKSILLITLVLTGSALLAGATLSEALGMFILGVALAWVVGSGAASQAYSFLLRLPGRSWPWLKVLCLMALSGGVLALVAVWSNFNSFLVVTAMSVWGMLISPLRHVPTRRIWLRILVWTIGVVCFFLATVGVSELITNEQNAERIGELSAYGLIALPIGMLWLAKGCSLIQAGISSAKPNGTPEVENVPKRTTWLHVSLFVGVVFLTACLGMLAFSGFGGAVLAFPTEPVSTPSNPVAGVIFLMVLAWWPYACWKTILKRRPNNTLVNLKNHKRVTVATGVFFTVVLSLAITFGIQNGHDRIASAQVEDGIHGFQDVAAKIGAIKSRDLHTTEDYISAYTEIDPLQSTFETKLQRVTAILSAGEQRYKDRGFLNIQRLFGDNEKSWFVWDRQFLGLLEQGSQLTAKEVLVAKQMATLPKEQQAEFWNENFRPLLEEEDAIRQKMASAKATMPHAD